MVITRNYVDADWSTPIVKGSIYKLKTVYRAF